MEQYSFFSELYTKVFTCISIEHIEEKILQERSREYMSNHYISGANH